MKFASYVTVIDPATGRCIDHISREAAVTQYNKGLIKAHLIRNGFVSWVERLDLAAPNTAKPGSFGIYREGLHTGHFVFTHKPHYGEVLAA